MRTGLEDYAAGAMWMPTQDTQTNQMPGLCEHLTVPQLIQVHALHRNRTLLRETFASERLGEMLLGRIGKPRLFFWTCPTRFPTKTMEQQAKHKLAQWAIGPL